MSIPDIKYLEDIEILSDLPWVVRLLREGITESNVFEAYAISVSASNNAIPAVGMISSIKLLAYDETEVISLSGGKPGNTAIIYAATSSVTLLDMSEGSNMDINGDPSAPSLPLLYGDIVVFTFMPSGNWIATDKNLAG